MKRLKTWSVEYPLTGRDDEYPTHCPFPSTCLADHQMYLHLARPPLMVLTQCEHSYLKILDDLGELQSDSWLDYFFSLVDLVAPPHNGYSHAGGGSEPTESASL